MSNAAIRRASNMLLARLRAAWAGVPMPIDTYARECKRAARRKYLATPKGKATSHMRWVRYKAKRAMS